MHGVGDAEMPDSGLRNCNTTAWWAAQQVRARPSGCRIWRPCIVTPVTRHESPDQFVLSYDRPPPSPTPPRLAQLESLLDRPTAMPASTWSSWLWPPADTRRGHLPRFTCGLRSRRTAVSALLVWRVLSALWMLGVAVWIWASSGSPLFYTSYLTNDALWLNVTYFCLSSLVTVDALCGATRPRGLRKHVHRVLSALLAIAVSFEFVVVVLFWVLLFRGVPEDAEIFLVSGGGHVGMP